MQYKSIIIIGNGFDLSHGLKTSYNSYLNNLIMRCGKKECHLITCDDSRLLSSSETFFNNAFGKQDSNGDYIPPQFKASCFLNNLLIDIKGRESDWCDIEQDYFDQIKEDMNNDSPRIKKINEEFNEVKKDLEDYLVNEENGGIEQLEQYEDFFNGFSNCLVINFNYTDILEKLYYKFTNENLYIHIHGRLHNKKNPIIFGYAADDRQINELLDKNDNEYLRNIKRFAYKRTDNETKIEKFLNDSSAKSINCYILGHSCGLSDKLILSTILNHSSIRKINICYFNDYEGYYNSLINIQRITRNNEILSKIATYPSSLKMPQYDDNPTQIDRFKDSLGEFAQRA
jgi:hypothetical protein